MDKKIVPQNTITRDVKDLAAPTGNLYESVVILYKRANQIALAEKKELNQIEISKYYERQPKPVLVAISEFENGELSYRMANHDNAESAETPAPARKVTEE